MGVATLPEGRLERLTAVSHHVAELVNIRPTRSSPTSARRRSPTRPACTRQRHRPPARRLRARRSRLGRQRHPVRRVRAGRPVDARAEGQGARPRARRQAARRRRRRSSSSSSHEGFHFEAADGSLELLMRRAAGWEQDFFRLESFRVTIYHRNASRGGVPIEDGESMIDTEATLKVWVGDERLVAHRRGQRPGQRARRTRCAPRSTARYPALDRIHLTDYKVRVLDTGGGHRRGRPGADRLDRRRALVDDHRRRARTSSRPPGRPSSTPSSSASCTRLTPDRARGARVRAVDGGRVRSVGRWLRPSTCPLKPTDAPRAYASPPAAARVVGGRPAGRGRRRRASPAATGSATRAPTRATRSGCSASSTDKLAARRRRARRGRRRRLHRRWRLKRASLFGRAPVVHDLTVAFTLWGFLDDVAAGRAGRAPPRRCSRRSATRTTTSSSGRSSTRCPSPPCA